MCISSFVQMHRLFFLFVYFFTVVKYTNCESCLTQNPCECVLSNGSVIDISSLGYHDKARFENVTATKKDEFTYFYNPCYKFKLGNGDCSKGVAVCQKGKTSDYNLGNSESGNFVIENNVIKLVYSGSGGRTTNVTLICSENAEKPEFTVEGEEPVKSTKYKMSLVTKCACPDLCRTPSHLSTGSVLVIIFMIFVSLYLVLGIIHSSLTRGAHGWELIPHHEFWADFPLLVRDGCVFVVNGCKADTAYDRI